MWFKMKLRDNTIDCDFAKKKHIWCGPGRSISDIAWDNIDKIVPFKIKGRHTKKYIYQKKKEAKGSVKKVPFFDGLPEKNK